MYFSNFSSISNMYFPIWISSRRKAIVILHDICVIPAAWFAAFYLRFNLDGIPAETMNTAIMFLLPVLVIQMSAYWSAGLYRGVWRFASLPDLLRITKAVLLGCFFSFCSLYILTQSTTQLFSFPLNNLPRSVLPIYGMLMIMLLGGSRFGVRCLKEHRRHTMGERVLIIGAGRAGEGLVRNLLSNIEPKYNPVAFIDDRKSKQGQEIHGIRVVGYCADIPRIVKEYNIHLILIAVPSARSEEMRLIMEYCHGTNCRVRTLPSINDLVSGRVSTDLLREVSLEDLLGRDPVSLDWTAIRSSIADQIVMVTGGGGSIGSELCRQIARLQPKQLLVIERSEFNLFSLEQELLLAFPKLKLSCHLLDLLDRPAVAQVFSHARPSIVFHAAAYKHVPMLESQPREAILNNIVGTRVIADLAVKYKVANFVLVSTDKAVNPTNIMGATKRVTEMICHDYGSRGKTQFITVRFGNVLGSAGSVIPIFKQQLERGGPITVTHPDITRFFMTIPEASQLILQALSIGRGGEIFVLDMGEPVKIQILAEQLIRLAGKKPGIDIEIRYTGLRPGEKLFEELFHPSEALAITAHEKIFQAKARSFNSPWFNGVLNAMEKACETYQIAELRRLLHELVPELEVKLDALVENKLENKVDSKDQATVDVESNLASKLVSDLVSNLVTKPVDSTSKSVESLPI